MTRGPLQDQPTSEIAAAANASCRAPFVPYPAHVLALSLGVSGVRKEFRPMQTQTNQNSAPGTPQPSASDLQKVSPALEHYQRATLFGDLWNRPDLGRRDRSIVTLAAV